VSYWRSSWVGFLTQQFGNVGNPSARRNRWVCLAWDRLPLRKCGVVKWKMPFGTNLDRHFPARPRRVCWRMGVAAAPSELLGTTPRHRRRTVAAGPLVAFLRCRTISQLVAPITIAERRCFPQEQNEHCLIYFGIFSPCLTCGKFLLANVVCCRARHERLDKQYAGEKCGKGATSLSRQAHPELIEKQYAIRSSGVWVTIHDHLENITTSTHFFLAGSRYAREELLGPTTTPHSTISEAHFPPQFFSTICYQAD